MQNLAIFGLISSVIGLAATNVVDTAVPGALAGGTALASLTVPALLGVIAIVSCTAMVRIFLLYKSSNDANNEALRKLIESNTVAITKISDAVETQNRSIERLQDTVAGCPNR